MTTPTTAQSASSLNTLLSGNANIVVAMLWMAVALASFTMVAIAGRAASSGVDTMHLMFYRSIIAWGLISLLIATTPTGFAQVSVRRIGLHTTRNIIHFIAQFSWLSALTLIPLAQLFAIEFTTPLWVAILAPLLLSERLTIARAVAALIGFVGIMVIIQPGTVTLGPGSAFAMLAAVGFACAMITTKKLVRTDTVYCVLFHMSWMQLLIAGISLIGNLTIPHLETLPWIAGVAVAGMTAHFALAQAFTHADAIIVAPMDFLRLPLIMFVGVALYDEQIEIAVLLGASIVILANLINIVGEQRHRS